MKSLLNSSAALQTFEVGMKKSILLVDDDDDIANLIYSHLKQDYEVVLSSYVSDAVYLFGKEPFDAIITDYLMTPRNGVYLIRQIRKANPDIPIFIISGYNIADIEPEIEGLNVSGIIKKPIEKDKLLEILKTRL